MKKNILLIVFGVIIILLTLWIVKLNYDIRDIDISNNDKANNGEVSNDEVNDNEILEDKDYDCSFIKTYRFLNKIDYPLAPEGVAFIVVDTFQGYNPFVVIVGSDVVDELEEYKYYEFKYTLKGRGIVNDFTDLNSYLIPSLFNKYYGDSTSGTVYIDLEVYGATKEGVQQVQENICQ